MQFLCIHSSLGLTVSKINTIDVMIAAMYSVKYCNIPIMVFCSPASLFVTDECTPHAAT